MSTSPYIFEVTAANYREAVIEKSRDHLVMVDFWAAWCGPCRMLAPIVEHLVADYQGAFLLGKLDTDAEPELAAQHGIRSIPTIKLFKEGAVVDEFHGVLPESQIRARIERHLIRPADRLWSEGMLAYAAGATDEAAAMLEQAAAQGPVRGDLLLDLAQVYITAGAYERAEERLGAVPIETQGEPRTAALHTLLALARAAEAAPADADLQARADAAPDDVEARYQYAARLVLQGRYEPAMELLLEILRRRPGFRDNAAQAAMVAVFHLLGDQNDLVSRYRRRMFAALH